MSPSYASDVELARRCAEGDEQAWDRFVAEYRPVLYRAADALDPSGGARELADSLYADLYGLRKDGAERRSLFQYFHGRSSLATWLRAVLSQRYVDWIRANRRLEPLPDPDRMTGRPAAAAQQRELDRWAVDETSTGPDRPRHLALMHEVLGRALADLSAKDRLRLACYYAQNLTLAETGRVLGEHEATVSRQIAKSRRGIRDNIEKRLRDKRLSDAEIAECFAAISEDAGTVDLDRMLAAAAGRKETAPDRSR